ncbi:MAG: hypothetical protein ACRD8A_12985 [Candidatus Acidiferrales bacterium]
MAVNSPRRIASSNLRRSCNDGAKFDTAGSGSDSDTDFNQSQYRNYSDDSFTVASVITIHVMPLHIPFKTDNFITSKQPRKMKAPYLFQIQHPWAHHLLNASCAFPYNLRAIVKRHLLNRSSAEFVHLIADLGR